MRVLVVGAVNWPEPAVVGSDVAAVFGRWPDAELVIGGWGVVDDLARDAAAESGREVVVVKPQGRKIGTWRLTVAGWLDRCAPDFILAYATRKAWVVRRVAKLAKQRGIAIQIIYPSGSKFAAASTLTEEAACPTE